jgi:hypothetical protein
LELEFMTAEVPEPTGEGRAKKWRLGRSTNYLLGRAGSFVTGRATDPHLGQQIADRGHEHRLPNVATLIGVEEGSLQCV